MDTPMATEQESSTEPRQSTFCLVEGDGPREDLVSRQEVKYVAAHTDIATLRKLLETNGRRLVYNKPVSTVRSIYFDDVQLSSCHANLGGIGRRQKVRVRWYDSLVPQENVFLEVKWRNNQITGKHRHALQTRQPLADLDYRKITDDLIDVLPPARVGDLLESHDPIVIVEYKREHFEARDASVRMTLDYDLVFYDQTGKRSLSTAFPQPMPDTVIVEGKTPPGGQQDVCDFLYPLTPRISPFSKYYHACRHLGLISG
ncbi:MAG TPA: hypothetical protein DCE47_18280 [Planctomycetaceae bacterium]|nr:hypothetical protein [Planctomycetaceae bacterium]HCD03416.1 hypothetical protein [Planctomycetaceae bacterium]|tara:strand:+ start:1117 stop:1890 length:774 start_codon:yes stop_codon:yes gene_type:complete